MDLRVPIERPQPDIEAFKQVIRREGAPHRVPFVELIVTNDIVEHIAKNYLGLDWVDPAVPEREAQEAYLRNFVEVFYRLGYDYVRIAHYRATLGFQGRRRTGQHSTPLGTVQRNWTNPHEAMIRSWEDFDSYPWPSLDDVDLWPLEFVAKILPAGMGMFCCPSSGIFEVGLNSIFGYESLCYLLHDDPELVGAVFNRIGELIYGFYEKTVGLDRLVGFFQGDDMGFKTSMLISPEDLRRYVLPWHKKIAGLAHRHGLLYLLHNCGAFEPIMDDLIEDVKIDAKHSFEDEIMPVGEFKRRYGGRVAVLGGVDVDKLCRLAEPELRRCVRDILDECAPDGGYCLGSGNSIPNYVPVENYLIMLEEGLRWSEGG